MFETCLVWELKKIYEKMDIAPRLPVCNLYFTLSSLFFWAVAVAPDFSYICVQSILRTLIIVTFSFLKQLLYHYVECCTKCKAKFSTTTWKGPFLGPVSPYFFLFHHSPFPFPYKLFFRKTELHAFVLLCHVIDAPVLVLSIFSFSFILSNWWLLFKSYLSLSIS